MPTRLRLHVISAADVPNTPPLDALGGISIVERFGQASMGELQIDVTEQRSTATSVDIDGAGLQTIFHTFVASPPAGQLASEIGLLFCRSWCLRDLAGLMFDYEGADLPPVTRVTSRGVNREACALFLDAEPAWSPADQIYVAMHELGHLFNLVHDPSNRSFMGFDTGADRVFLDEDRARLRAAAAGPGPEQTMHLPGGAPFRGVDAPAHRGDQSRGERFACRGLIARRGKT